MINKIFHDRYLQEKELGGGLASKVFKAKDQLTGEIIALKVYTGQDEDIFDGFAREYAIVSNVNHPNVLAPKHFDTCDSKPYLVLPFCEQGSVMKLIKTPENNPIDEREAWKLLRDVASGIAYLHSMRPPIIHQDIKPDNILVNDLGDYVITDFGISTHTKATEQQLGETLTKNAGTTAYMAPERFEEDAFPIMANDVYSLGATVYEILTGDAPFSDFGGRGQDADSTIPEISEDYSDELKTLVLSCLCFDPSKRPFAVNIAKKAQEWLDSQKRKGRPTLENGNGNDPGDPVIPAGPQKPSKHTIAWYYYIITSFVGFLIGIVMGLKC